VTGEATAGEEVRISCGRWREYLFELEYILGRLSFERRLLQV
jgi:hypothetical protein